jgi:D-hexose-6-phosphate mutarotase
MSVDNLNPSNQPFSFTSALHAYFAVSDISNVRISSVENLKFLDQLQKDDNGRSKQFLSDVSEAMFDGEFDRIFFDSFSAERENSMFITDSGFARKFKVCISIRFSLPFRIAPLTLKSYMTYNIARFR